MNNKTPTILITGANGQLGTTFRALAINHPAYHFIFTSKKELQIDLPAAIDQFFEQYPINYCINCAAYTTVDQSETEKEKAFTINATAVGYLAATCKKYKATLIHISTDYVFDGMADKPYSEESLTAPVNTYGASKLKGEALALQNNPDTIIIRSSWLYAQHGHNFVKTMLRLMKEKECINVVNDQFGCPTYTSDLADAIMQIILKLPIANYQLPLILNYANAGITTWFGFAQAIKEFTGSGCIINPVPTSQYPTAAKRPQYSVLDTSKIQEIFHITIPNWKNSLQKCLEDLR